MTCFVLHTQLSNFCVNKHHGIRFYVENILWYHKRRPVITNLHTLSKASGPKRHHAEKRCTNSQIEYLFKTQDPEIT